MIDQRIVIRTTQTNENAVSRSKMFMSSGDLSFAATRAEGVVAWTASLNMLVDFSYDLEVEM